jgi:hypothetical protein
MLLVFPIESRRVILSSHDVAKVMLRPVAVANQLKLTRGDGATPWRWSTIPIKNENDDKDNKNCRRTEGKEKPGSAHGEDLASIAPKSGVEGGSLVFAKVLLFTMIQIDALQASCTRLHNSLLLLSPHRVPLSLHSYVLGHLRYRRSGLHGNILDIRGMLGIAYCYP